MFKPNDIVVEIGSTLKWRILEVRNANYRVEQVCCVGRYITTFDKEWVERDFVKVNVYHWAYGEDKDENLSEI
jgi:hypothetical protein